MLSQTELKEKVEEIRRRGITPAELAEEARIYRVRLSERLEVSLNRLRELKVSYTKDERHCADAQNESKLALLAEIERVRGVLANTTRPAEDIREELSAFVGRIVDEFKTGIDKSERAKNMAEAKYFRDQLNAVRKASDLLTNELGKLPELWAGDHRSCAEQRATTRESEVLSLLRSQEDARNQEIESEKRRRLNAVAGQIQDRRAANAAAGIHTDEVAKPGQY